MRDEDLVPFMARWVLTQTDAGGGLLRADIIPQEGNYLEINHLGIGLDNYGANRSITANLWKGSALIAYLMSEAAIDNKLIRLLPSRHVSTAVVDTETAIGAAIMPMPLMRGHTLIISTDALVQNETLTITLEGRCKKVLPTPTITNSGGTPSISETYNRTV